MPYLEVSHYENKYEVDKKVVLLLNEIKGGEKKKLIAKINWL